MALHKESIVIDASTVGFIEGVGEDIMLDDLLKGGVDLCQALPKVESDGPRIALALVDGDWRVVELAQDGTLFLDEIGRLLPKFKLNF